MEAEFSAEASSAACVSAYVVSVIFAASSGSTVTSEGEWLERLELGEKTSSMSRELVICLLNCYRLTPAVRGWNLGQLHFDTLHLNFQSCAQLTLLYRL